MSKDTAHAIRVQLNDVHCEEILFLTNLKFRKLMVWSARGQATKEITFAAIDTTYINAVHLLHMLCTYVRCGYRSFMSDLGTLMTNSDESLDLVKQAIREAGLRATPARIATLQLLRESPSPLTHAVVAEHLAATGVDKATAFRNLNDMTEAGLLRRTEVGDHVWRFEATRGEGEHDTGHPHFLCVDCGAVSCLEDVKLTAGSQRASKKFGEVTEILLRGHCNDCR